jgi:hypothetical protein
MLALLLTHDVFTPKPWEDVGAFVQAKPYIVVYMVNPVPDTASTQDLVMAFGQLQAKLPAFARHLLVLQIIPAEWLATPGLHGPANRSNVAATARGISLAVYLKCRAVVYPKQSLLLSDAPTLPPCEVYCPPYVLRAPRVEIPMGRQGAIHVAQEMAEHVLHVAYAVSGRLLLCVATDAQGGYAMVSKPGDMPMTRAGPHTHTARHVTAAG